MVELSDQFEPGSNRMVTHLHWPATTRGNASVDSYFFLKAKQDKWRGVPIRGSKWTWERHQHVDVVNNPSHTEYAREEMPAVPIGPPNPTRHSVRLPHPGYSGRDDMTWSEQERLEAARKDLADEPGGQRRLFGMAHDPGESHVSFMGGSEEGRIHALTLLGIAHNRLARYYPGRVLQTPRDLSEHSARLIGHLRERGIVPGQGEPPVTNRLTFATFSHTTEEDEMMVTRAEVLAGRRTARQALRPPQGPVHGPVYGGEQLRLFE